LLVARTPKGGGASLAAPSHPLRSPHPGEAAPRDGDGGRGPTQARQVSHLAWRRRGALDRRSGAGEAGRCTCHGSSRCRGRPGAPQFPGEVSARERPQGSARGPGVAGALCIRPPPPARRCRLQGNVRLPTATWRHGVRRRLGLWARRGGGRCRRHCDLPQGAPLRASGAAAWRRAMPGARPAWPLLLLLLLPWPPCRGDGLRPSPALPQLASSPPPPVGRRRRRALGGRAAGGPGRGQGADVAVDGPLRLRSGR